MLSLLKTIIAIALVAITQAQISHETINDLSRQLRLFSPESSFRSGARTAAAFGTSFVVVVKGSAENGISISKLSFYAMRGQNIDVTVKVKNGGTSEIVASGNLTGGGKAEAIDLTFDSPLEVSSSSKIRLYIEANKKALIVTQSNENSNPKRMISQDKYIRIVRGKCYVKDDLKGKNMNFLWAGELSYTLLTP